jgi:soluble lytic murein transglycosylase
VTGRLVSAAASSRVVRWGAIGALAVAALVEPASRLLAQDSTPGLVPTAHDPVPADPAAYWLPAAAPAGVTPALKEFAKVVLLIDGGSDVRSISSSVLSSSLDATPLVDHVRYYRGLLAERQNQLDVAAAIYSSLATSTARSYVAEQALWHLADVYELRGEYAQAADVFARLIAAKPAELDRAWYRRGVALERSGDRVGSVAAHRVVYYDYPLAGDAAASGTVLDRLESAGGPFPDRAEKIRARADALYAARRWTPARAAYIELAAIATGDLRERAEIRIAAADVQAKQFKPAVERLRPRIDAGAHQAEARMHYALALRGLGNEGGYVQAVRALAEAHPQSPFAEEALNTMGTWYTVRDDDESAAAVFELMLQRFPSGKYAERAAWKAGWWAYRRGDMAAAIAAFETGARHFPRSDYRPAWLYWSGRAKQRAGDAAGATARLVLAATDYYNSYYGRLALTHLGDAAKGIPTRVITQPDPRDVPPPTERQIGLLMALELYDLALAEVQFARRVWGDSPALMATAAMAQHRAGRLRLGINAMKRAYPQYLAAGGESLPPDVLRVIFPADYWQQLQGSARRRGLDPFLVLALAAQESTFDAAIKSSAGAIGLMQIMPATGRQVARQLGIKPFSTRRLTDPEVNMAIGTEYFADLMERFGHAAYALAGYNAGAHRVVKWKGEKPGLPIDEWIDDIPFPETQNYVKRILGTAEDYRRLYGGGVLTPLSSQPRQTVAATSSAPARKTAAPKRPARRTPTSQKPSSRPRPRG